MVWQPHTPPLQESATSETCCRGNQTSDTQALEDSIQTAAECQGRLSCERGFEGIFWQSFWPPSLWAVTLVSVSGVHAISYCSLSDKNIAAVFGRLTCISTAWTKPWWITDLLLNGVSLSGAGGREPTLFLFMRNQTIPGYVLFSFPAKRKRIRYHTNQLYIHASVFPYICLCLL